MSETNQAIPEPGGLLSMLFRKGLVRQSEVAVTQSLAWLCTLPDGRNALDPLINAAGVDAGDDPVWYAEVVADDKTRTDVEGWWGVPSRPQMVIEAKVTAALTDHQVDDYAKNLSRQREGEPQDGLLVVLVPEYRRREAESVLDRVVSEERKRAHHLRTAVWSYDEVLLAMTDALGDSGDLAQFRHFISACEALDIRPISEAELSSRAESRWKDLTRVLDGATASFFSEGQRVLPSGRDTDFSWRRYLEVTPGGTNVAVGLRAAGDQTAANRSWAWLRVHRDTHDAENAGNRLRDGWPDDAYTDEAGSTWLPLQVPTSVAGAAMVAKVVSQIETVVSTLRELEPKR